MAHTHRPPNTRSGGGRQNMPRNPTQFPQLYPNPRGGAGAPLIPSLPQAVFPPQMATAPNRQRAPLLSTVPNQPIFHPNLLTHLKMQQAQMSGSLAATNFMQSVPTPTLSHLRAPSVPPVTGPIIPQQVFPHGSIQNFQQSAMSQPPPHFVTGGQPQPQVQYTKPQPIYSQPTANHQGLPQAPLVKKPSKAIKIVNPDTGKEVDTNAVPSASLLDRTSGAPSSSAVEIVDPTAETRKKEFMEKVTSTVGKSPSAPNAIISAPHLPANATQTGSINLQVDAAAEKQASLTELGKNTASGSSTSLMSTHAKEFTPSASYSIPVAAVPSDSADDLVSETIKKPQEDATPVAEKTLEAPDDSLMQFKTEPPVETKHMEPEQLVAKSHARPDDQPQTKPTPELQEETKVVNNKVESPVDIPSAKSTPLPESVPCATPSLSSGSSGSITNEERPTAPAAVDPEKPVLSVVPVVQESQENSPPEPDIEQAQEEDPPLMKQADEIEPDSSSSAPEPDPSEPVPSAPAAVSELTDLQDLPLLKPVPGEPQLLKRSPPPLKEAKAVVTRETELDKKAGILPERTMSERAVRDKTKDERTGKRSPLSERPSSIKKESDRSQRQTKQEMKEPEPVNTASQQKLEKLVKENLVVEKRRQDKVSSEGQVEKQPLVNGDVHDKDHRQAYNREFLLQFRKKLLVPPPHLINSEVYRIPSRDGSDMFAPSFAIGMPRKGGRNPPRDKKVISVNREEVQLNKAENRWVRPSERQKEQTEEEKETVEVFRKFQGILNKLTPQKFKDLAEQALALKINTDERLRGCIDKIFKKALEEPNFSVAYANLCRVMSPTKVEVVKMEDGKETQSYTTFRRELLTKCQREFEKDKKDDEEREKMMSAINAAETAEEKQSKKAELETWQTMARKRSLGNIRFIGELFKLKMLSEGIMHECIYRLLRSGSDEESLECFCRLITTTGKELDHEQAKQRLDQYFDRIDEIRKKKKVSSRIRFMLQDVLDLRKSDWVPRRQESLKTIDQIHYEAQLEKEKEKEMLRHVSHVPTKTGRARDMPEKGRALKPQGGPDEWRTKEISSRRESKPDLNRIQGILKRDRGKETPAGFRPQKWGMKPGSATPPMEPKGDRSKMPLRSSSGGGSKRPVPAGNSRALPPSTRRMGSQPDSAREMKAAIKLAAQISSQPSTEPSPTHAVLDEALIERKAVCIVEELEQTTDFREAVACVQEMNCPDMLHVFVHHAINHTLELSSAAREMVGKLFQLLIEERVLSTDRFQAGCAEVLTFADDLEVDIPKFWDYLAEMSAPAVYYDHLSLALLTQMVREAGFGHKAAVCVVKVLSVGNSLFGKQKTSDLWNQSQLAWKDLGDEIDTKELLARHGLEFLFSPCVSGSVEDLPYLNDLSILFRAQDKPNDDILTWIEKNCSPQECNSPHFIHSLTQAAIGAATNGEGETCRFTEDVFKNRLLLLKKHADENESLQLEILYASQVAVTKLKHPPGLLYQIFWLLYDVEVVSESICRAWKESGSEEFGRGVALQATSNFFEWLGSTECESDAET